jgi:Zn-dependent protease
MTFIVVLLGWIFSLCLHEFSHALVAYHGGDLSVRDKGYLTFNPLRYTDPMLSIVMPLIFLLLGGLGLPGGAVYIDRSRLRSKYWASAVSLAGPVSNLFLAGVLSLLLQIEVVSKSTFGPGLAALALLQIIAVCLNLLPIPPLDGYHILSPFLDDGVRAQLDSVSRFSLWGLFLIMWYVPAFAKPFWNLTYRFAAGIGIPLRLAVTGLDQFRFWVK